MSQSVLEPEDTCRICLEGGELDNPLIHACKCIGSVGFVHLRCLRSWLNKQIKPIKTPLCTTIEWKPLCCEMCKSQYKYRIYLDNKKFYTVDIPRPHPPYIVLEVVRKDPDLPKIFKFVSFQDRQKINLGRKKEIDVRISEDISVSRVHAVIAIDRRNKAFTIQDNNSKFGTLVLARNGILARPSHPTISLQVGAELFQFQSHREVSEVKCENFDSKDNFMIEEESVIDEDEDNDHDSNPDDNDEILKEAELFSPEIHRSDHEVLIPDIRRTEILVSRVEAEPQMQNTTDAHQPSEMHQPAEMHQPTELLSVEMHS